MTEPTQLTDEERSFIFAPPTGKEKSFTQLLAEGVPHAGGLAMLANREQELQAARANIRLLDRLGGRAPIQRVGFVLILVSLAFTFAWQYRHWMDPLETLRELIDGFNPDHYTYAYLRWEARGLAGGLLLRFAASPVLAWISANKRKP